MAWPWSASDRNAAQVEHRSQVIEQTLRRTFLAVDRWLYELPLLDLFKKFYPVSSTSYPQSPLSFSANAPHITPHPYLSTSLACMSRRSGTSVAEEDIVTHEGETTERPYIPEEILPHGSYILQPNPLHAVLSDSNGSQSASDSDRTTATDQKMAFSYKHNAAEEASNFDRANSGACAVVVHHDPQTSHLYTAIVGDSRVVAGLYDDQTDTWTAQPLTVDQTLHEPAEVERLLSRHPLSEALDITRRYRILGGLQPARAFGDVKYKYHPALFQMLNDHLDPQTRRRVPALSLTPPYLDADPQISRYKVDGRHRFVIVATDGLWDELTNDEVGFLAEVEECINADNLQAVALVAHSLRNKHATDTTQIKKPVNLTDRDLMSIMAPNSSQSSLPETMQTHAQDEQKYTFKDANLATHLIRNALGGSRERHLASLLTIPAPHSRRFRDDMTGSSRYVCLLRLAEGSFSVCIALRPVGMIACIAIGPQQRISCARLHGCVQFRSVSM